MEIHVARKHLPCRIFIHSVKNWDNKYGGKNFYYIWKKNPSNTW